MMGCFSTSHTDGTEESHHISLRSLMAAKQTPIPSPSMAKKIIERKLGLSSTRKTLQARTNLLDTACHNLAKAKQRTLVAFPPSYYLKSDIALFPLPLPPGYKPPTNNRSTSKSNSLSKSRSTTKGTSPLSKSSSLPKASSNSIKSKRIDVNCANVPASNHPIHVHSTSSSVSSNSPASPCHCHSNSTATCHSSACEALTPSSTTSSCVFSAAPSSLSQSSSFSSSSANSRELLCNALAVDAFENESSFFNLLPPPPPTHKVHAVSLSLKEFSPLEIARACGNFDDTYKLRDGSMGPFYRAFLPEEQSVVAIARVETELSRKKWRAQMQKLATLEHPNVCKVIGFSYEMRETNKRAPIEGMRVANIGCIVYESIGNESLEEFVQDVEKGHSHVDWSTRLNIAIGLVEGLSFLLQNHVSYGDLTMSNVLVDLSSNAKLFDFILSTVDKRMERKSSHVVQTVGNVLLKLFDFMSYPQDEDTPSLRERSEVKKLYPPRDAKVVIQLAASCLLAEDFLRPSIQHVACVLRSIEPTQHKAKFSIKRSKSFTYRREKSLSFG